MSKHDLCKTCEYFDGKEWCYVHQRFVSESELEDCPDWQSNWKWKHKNNTINPNHYKQGRIECIDALESATINKKGIEAVCVANVIKYLWRYEEKNGLEDVKKCQWYLNRVLEHLENKSDE